MKSQLLFEKFQKYYAHFEAFVIRDEKDEDVRIAKKVLVHYVPVLFTYYVLLLIFNPYFTQFRGIVSCTGLTGYYFALRAKNFLIPVMYLMGFALVLQYTCSKEPTELLRAICMILSQYNQTMVLARYKKLHIVFIIVCVILARNSQVMLNQLIEQNDFEKIKHAIWNLQYSWPFLYAINTFFLTNMSLRSTKVFHEYRATQAELEKKNQELCGLNEKLQKTLSLLEQTNKELNDAIKSRELFIASVSHELRNPLNSMLGNIELLSLDVKNPKWLNMLDTCKICGEVLLGLINNILDVAKINAERLELNCQPANLYRLLEKVWVVSTIKMRQKGIKGHLSISKNVPKYIEIDSHRLNQILLNLIGNATKFTKEGSVKMVVSWYKDGNLQDLQGSGLDFAELINLKTRQLVTSYAPQMSQTRRTEISSLLDLPREDSNSDSFSIGLHKKFLKRSIHIRSLTQLNSSKNLIEFDENDIKLQEKLGNGPLKEEKEKGVLKVEIIDSGCGISKAAIQRIFQPFSQADSSITRRFGGTGLGLYITKQLIQKMGGQVGFESHKNVGSSFWMILPTHTVKKTEVEEDNLEIELGRTGTKNLETLRVLIVDDDPLNQMIIKSYLKKLNIHAETANNGLEALQKFQTKDNSYYSLITMDIQMPIMDGLSACKAIRRYERERKAKKNIPIIIVSANCIDFEKNQCLDPSGDIKASYFFRKPFTFEECRSSVNSLLHHTETKSNDHLNSKRRIRVLIVDDDLFNRTTLKEYLEKYSFECETCTNGKEAVYRAEQQYFDVILMDCEMPEMDGYTASKYIRAKYPKIPIIGVTGHTRETCLQKARDNGMNDIETKPINFDRLLHNIRKYFE